MGDLVGYKEITNITNIEKYIRNIRYIREIYRRLYDQTNSW